MMTEHTWALHMGLEKSVAFIRRSLRLNGLNVVAELDLSASPDSADTRGCVVLLVDTPELLFEAIALDRGAAVLVPVHIVLSGDRDSSRVHWANPLANSGLRAPASARLPIERLCVRVRQTLAGALESAATAVQ
jgi:uncharacterized protein (DUF302 family)